MLAAYKGGAPYIFVSYAHKDSKTVVPIIDALQERGYRIWFDEGIEAGSEWSNNIAAHLKACTSFLAFISENSVASENCLDEIAYAKAHQKPSLLIFLEEKVELPEGTEMQTARFQRMFYSRHKSDESFIGKLVEAPILDPCWEAPAEEDVPSDVKEMLEEPAKVEKPENIPEEEEILEENDLDETPEEKKKRRSLGKTLCWVGALLELSYSLLGPRAMELILNLFENGWIRFLLMILPHVLIAFIIRQLAVMNAEKLTFEQLSDVFGSCLICWLIASVLAVVIGTFYVPLEINGFLKFLLSLGLNVIPALVSVIIYFTISDLSGKKRREEREAK